MNDFIIDEIQKFNRNNKYRINKVRKGKGPKSNYSFETSEENPKNKHIEDLVHKFINFKRNLQIKNKPVCKSKSYIDEILRGTFFSFTYTELEIDPTNYEKVNQIFAGDSYTTISNRFFKEMHHYLKIVDVITDSGIIFTSSNSEEFIQTDYIKEMTDFRLSDHFLAYSMKISTKKETYFRSYLKLQVITAELGGIIKSITVICSVIVYFYNQMRFYEYISDNIFDNSIKDDRKILSEIFASKRDSLM